MSNLGALAVVATAVAGIVGAYLALRRAPAEREGVYISTAEGATRILNSAMIALEKDSERKSKTIEGLESTIEHCRAALLRKDEVIETQAARIRKLEARLGEDAPP